MSYHKSGNIGIGNICSPGFAYLELSYYKTRLTFDFAPWLSRDNTGRDYYCKRTRQSTTVDYDGAKLFYQIAKAIIDGSSADKQVETVLSCKRGAELIFEYKPENDGQMMAYLTISKNKKSIPFIFPLHQYYEVDEKGQRVTKVIQRGLGTFAKVMQGYLIDFCNDYSLNRLPEGFNEYQDYNKQVLNQQASLAMWNSVQR